METATIGSIIVITLPLYIFNYRELLKSALAKFEDDPEKYLSTQAEALSSLAYLCSKMGDWKEGEFFLMEAKDILARSSDQKNVSQCKEYTA